MVAVPGEVAEGGVHLAEETGSQQLELDLLQGPPVELLGDFDL